MYKVVWSSRFFFIITFVFFQISANSQIKSSLDSLKNDSVKQPEIFISKSDTIDNFIPIDSLNFKNNFFFSEKKNPKRAALFSFILPGLGQAYNEKYAKIPFIYGIFAGMYYLYDNNNFRYNLYRKAYNKYAKLGDSGGSIVPEGQVIPLAQLKDRRDSYRRDRDYNIIIGVVIYIFNILDANVDAHLMDFDVSDDLSMKITPTINNYSIYNQNNHGYDMKNSFGLKFAISIK